MDNDKKGEKEKGCGLFDVGRRKRKKEKGDSITLTSLGGNPKKGGTTTTPVLTKKGGKKREKQCTQYDFSAKRKKGKKTVEYETPLTGKGKGGQRVSASSTRFEGGRGGEKKEGTPHWQHPKTKVLSWEEKKKKKKNRLPSMRSDKKGKACVVP